MLYNFIQSPIHYRFYRFSEVPHKEQQHALQNLR